VIGSQTGFADEVAHCLSASQAAHASYWEVHNSKILLRLQAPDLGQIPGDEVMQVTDLSKLSKCHTFELPLEAMFFVPQPLTNASDRVLEFDGFCELLQGYAYSPLGKSRIVILQASQEKGWIERQQRLTAEIRQFLRVGGRFEFWGLT